MSSSLVLAISAITAALIAYTAGVFSVRKAMQLNKTHVIMFWVGFVFDVLGTLTMQSIASGGDFEVKSRIIQYLHSITGILAILLMLFSAAWATWVLYGNDADKKIIFHKFSIVVWGIWLIPYFIGMYIGMMH